MANDRRKKGCPNVTCIMNEKMIRQKSEIDYCPKCGTRLVFVCEKCFTEIEDDGVKHRICSLCEAKAEEKRQKVKDNIANGAQKAGKAVVGVAAPVVVGVVGKVVKDGQKGAIKAGVKIIEDAAKTVFKR